MTVRAVGMMTTILTNTIKMIESERHLRRTEDAPLDATRAAAVQDQLIPIFEGMSCFTVGTDDTLRNMVWKMEPFMEVDPVGPILREVWTRFQTEDTVFSRFKALHTREKTSWWEDD